MVAVSVVIPTLTAGEPLEECLAALDRQSFRDFEVIVVDNSGLGLVQRRGTIHNKRNVGYGAAINQGCTKSGATYVAALNDDAVPAGRWLEALVEAIESDGSVGMCASRVLLANTGRVDSAGMLMARDGSSKQRGHGEPAGHFDTVAEVLFPSGSAALYRRSMLLELEGFAEDFFLYCEDTDLGLRARARGWGCLYAPGAVVEHRYSHSAGRASPLKAYLVERNRLWTVVRNFPAPALLLAPFASLVRYFWHAWFVVTGEGTGAEYARQSGALQLAWFVLKAHASTLLRLPKLLAERRAIRSGARLTNAQLTALLRRHSISLRQVASL